MYHWLLASLLLVLGISAGIPGTATAADEKKPDKAAEALKDAIEKADIIVIGKVSQVGLSTASSFDVGSIDVSEVLKGDDKTKTVNFRFSSRNTPPYGKKGVEGVWILDKEGAYMAARAVLSFQPLTEADAVKKLLPKKEKPADPSK
jgi:hypothetical protein